MNNVPFLGEYGYVAPTISSGGSKNSNVIYWIFGIILAIGLFCLAYAFWKDSNQKESNPNIQPPKDNDNNQPLPYYRIV